MTIASAPITRERIEEALNLVHDPCSVAAGRPMGLTDMGLVTDIAIEGCAVVVTLRATFAGCLMMPHLTEAAERTLSDVPGIEQVDVQVDMRMTWTPADMVPREKPLPIHRQRQEMTLEPIGGSAMKGAR